MSEVPVKIEWVKIISAIVGMVFAVGVAWAMVQAGVKRNASAICSVCEDVQNLEETDKEIISQMNDTEIILRGIQTDIEWIRATMENGN